MYLGNHYSKKSHYKLIDVGLTAAEDLNWDTVISLELWRNLGKLDLIQLRHNAYWSSNLNVSGTLPTYSRRLVKLCS